MSSVKFFNRKLRADRFGGVPTNVNVASTHWYLDGAEGSEVANLDGAVITLAIYSFFCFSLFAKLIPGDGHA